MKPAVEIAFDCMPLRSIGRMDIPLDASPKFRERYERIQAAIQRHGRHNSYYLYNAHCRFQLTNDAHIGMLEFQFRGTVLTDPSDQRTQETHLELELIQETCEWLCEPAVSFFHETVRRAVIIEFDRYIQAGDMAQTIKRLEKLQEQSDDLGGYLGMFL